MLEGSFGQSGKYKIRFRQGVPAEVQEALGQKGAGKKGGIVNDGVESDLTLTLSFKKYVYSLDEKMVQ